MIGLKLIQRNYLSGDDWNVVSKSYCGVCAGLREDFGTLASFLLNDEVQFLALLIVAQKKEMLSDSLTKCPIYAHTREFPILGDKTALQYAATVAMLLAGEKLDDNIRDENIFIAKSLRKVLSGHIEKSQNIISLHGFPLEKLIQIRSEQALAEKRLGETLEYYLSPTAKIVEEIFSRTAVLSNAPENFLALREIGFSAGKIITLIDACEDIYLDRRQKQFNPIISSYGQKAILDLKVIKNISYIFMKELNSIRKALAQLNIYRFEGVIENVLTRGLPERILESLAFFWKNNHWKGNLDLLSDLDLDIQAMECPQCHQPHHFSRKYSLELKEKPIRAPKNLWVITSSLFENGNQLAIQFGFHTPEDYLFVCLFPSLIIANAKNDGWKSGLERLKRITQDQNINQPIPWQ